MKSEYFPNKLFLDRARTVSKFLIFIQKIYSPKKENMFMYIHSE